MGFCSADVGYTGCADEPSNLQVRSSFCAVSVQLVSLSPFSSCCSEGDMCRPDLVPSASPFLEIRGGKHPCVTQTYTGDDFIPNDVTINSGESPSGATCVVVTGPNMGGKSTLMRQTGLIVILAQLVRFMFHSSCVPIPFQFCPHSILPSTVGVLCPCILVPAQPRGPSLHSPGGV